MERRERIVWVSERGVWGILSGYVGVRPIFSGIPQDANLECVEHCFYRRAFGFILSHPSFAPVPDGEERPYEIQMSFGGPKADVATQDTPKGFREFL